MNEQSQRIAIATFCGWQAIELRDSIKSGQKDWLSGLNPKPDKIVKVIDLESGEERAPNESDYGYETLPDYPRDLNAIHDAEIVCIFTKGKGMVYGRELYLVCNREPSVEVKGVAFNRWSFSATAKQRCEALLKTIGEWRD